MLVSEWFGKDHLKSSLQSISCFFILKSHTAILQVKNKTIQKQKSHCINHHHSANQIIWGIWSNSSNQLIYYISPGSCETYNIKTVTDSWSIILSHQTKIFAGHLIHRFALYQVASHMEYFIPFRNASVYSIDTGSTETP